MRKLLEAMDFAGEPEQKPGDYSTGVKKPESKGKFLGKPYKREEHPDKNKLVGESEGEEVEESPATELNRATAKARLPDRENREQRGVWQQHYQRALRNGRDDRAARRYADTMTGSESKFQMEGELDEGRGLCHGCYVRDKEDPSQEVFKMRGDPDDRNVWIGDNQGRGWYVHASRLVKVRDGDPGIDEYFGDAELEEAPDVALDIAEPDKPKSVFQTPGLSPAARALAAKRMLAKQDQEQALTPDQQRVADLNKPKPQFNSRDFDVDSALIEAMTKAYEDYVSNEKYDADTIYPPKSKKPSADKKKPKAPKVVDPNRVDEEVEKCPECHGSGQDREQGGRCQKCGGSGNAPVKEMFPNRDSGASEPNDRLTPQQRYDKLMAKKKAQAAKAKKPTPSKVEEADDDSQFKNDKNGKRLIDLNGNPIPNKKSEQPAKKKEKPYPNTWNDVDSNLGTKVGKMSQDEKVKKGWAAPKKKEKPFKDAAATGNPRDFANEGKGKDPFADTPWNEKAVKAKQMSDYKKKTGLDKEAPKDPKTVNKDGKTMYEAKGPSKEQAKANDAEWAKIEAHWKKLHGKDVQMPSGPAGDQKMRQAWNKKNKKKTS